MARAIRGYADTARRVREAGVDGVEISCWGPSLVGQFWTPITNQRSDRYGGSLQNRMRFGIEVLEAVRAEVGEDFVVGIRVSGDEIVDGGLSQSECIEITRHYAAAGLAIDVPVLHATRITDAARKDLKGIVDWYTSEVERLGVTLRLNQLAEAEDVLP